MGGRDNEGVWDGHAHTAVIKTGSPTMTCCVAQCGSLHGRRVWGSTIHVCAWLSPVAMHLKLSQRCLLIDHASIQSKKKIHISKLKSAFPS